jgi:hypothetical protein
MEPKSRLLLAWNGRNNPIKPLEPSSFEKTIIGIGMESVHLTQSAGKGSV